VTVGHKVYNGPDSGPDVGNCLPLANIPVGLDIHNVEMNPGQGGKARPLGGPRARLSSKEGDYAVVTLPSGEIRRSRASAARRSARSATATG
jgi:large subunit ribosomal protein L2